MSASLSDDEVLSLLFEGCDLRAPGGPAETRRLAREIKRARHLALLPFCTRHR